VYFQEELCDEFDAATTTDQAPVNICLQDTKPVAVPDLVYSNYDATPTKMRMNNTGFTGKQREKLLLSRSNYHIAQKEKCNRVLEAAT